MTVEAGLTDGAGQVGDLGPTEGNEQASENDQTGENGDSGEADFNVIPEEFYYSLTVSINPLVELYFDENNTIVGIEYLNQDAVDTYKDVPLMGCELESGMDLLVNAAQESGYINNDATIEIELAKVSEDAADSFDSNILVEASQVVSDVIDTICEEQNIDIEVNVEISVVDEIEDEVGIVAPVICDACNGTGNDCQECNGTAIVNCKRCVNGVETCGTCNGTAIINCHGCHGAGGDCNHCGGTGLITCDACNGQATFTCSWCAGALKHICPICWGEGSCAKCGGDGVL